jgi:hypothetical protein
MLKYLKAKCMNRKALYEGAMGISGRGRKGVDLPPPVEDPG